MAGRIRENDEGPTTYEVIVYQVEAMHVTAEHAQPIARWCGGEVATDIHPTDRSIRFSKIGIPTLKGVEWALDDDYVVKWPGAGFTGMTRSEFESLFQRANPENVS